MKKLFQYFMVLIFAVSFTPTIQAASAQTPITKSQAESRALAMINYSWTYSSEQNSNISAQYASLVTQTNQLNSGQMTGIPYCWGGLDGIDTASYNQSWSNFGESVQMGAYTGNTNSDGGIGYVPGTSGLDCSGFVQAAFDIEDYKQSSASLLTNYFTQISMDEITHMDVLVLSGTHILIFDQWGYYNGIYGAYTYESTDNQTFGGIQGAKEYFIDMGTIDTGYVAARYNYLAEEATPSQSVETDIFAKVTDNVNLRTAASTSAGVIKVIPQNSIIYVGSYVDGWYNVRVNGSTGWVWGEYIASIPAGTFVTVKNATMLNVRSGAGTASSILGTLSAGQYAKILDYSSDGKWMKIQTDNVTGWSSSPYLSYIY